MTEKQSTRIETITVIIQSGDPPTQIIATDRQRLRTRIRVNLPKAP